MKSGLYLCGPPRRIGRRQGFPSRFWNYFKRDFVRDGDRGLHLFGGSAPEWSRVDNDPESGAEFVQDAFADPPPHEMSSYDVVLADPPYTKKFSGDWGVEQPSPKRVLDAARRWTKVGGRIALLHILVPARPKWAEREAIIGVLSGPHNVIRCLSVYRCVAPVDGEEPK
jgi:SAM-dependent methyltransferase